MLRRISIRDFAIIDSLELEFGPGMSVLTGETGAGKSILIEALSLALGERADSGSVRNGAKRAEVTVYFGLADCPAAREWLAQHGRAASNDECALKRIVSSDGRSRHTINDSAVSLDELRALSETLAEIHGQHLHHSLLKKESQRIQIDEIAGNATELAFLREAFQAWQHLQQRREKLTAESEQRDRKLALVQAELAELSALALSPDEPANLLTEQSRLAHADALKTATLGAFYALYENDERSVDRDLTEIVRALDPHHRLDPSLSEPIGLIESAKAQAREAAEWLRRYGDRLEMDPERLAEVDRRLGQIHTLARKHRLQPEGLSERQAELEVELAELQGPQWDLEGLLKAVDVAQARYGELALGIRARREKAAVQVSKDVTTAMQELGMGGGRFEARLRRREWSQAATYGLDDIEFYVSANPGTPLKPLAKVASGGELARISLALQIVALGTMTASTLVFDEVDSGIGGAVAEIVGRKLRQLGTTRQVFCVTHLAQVAAQAHNHFRVHKSKAAGRVHTHIEQLREDTRAEEVARMLGGIDLTESTRSHAREMIDKAQSKSV